MRADRLTVKAGRRESGRFDAFNPTLIALLRASSAPTGSFDDRRLVLAPTLASSPRGLGSGLRAARAASAGARVLLKLRARRAADHLAPSAAELCERTAERGRLLPRRRQDLARRAAPGRTARAPRAAGRVARHVRVAAEPAVSRRASDRRQRQPVQVGQHPMRWTATHEGLGAGACYIEWRALLASFSPFEAHRVARRRRAAARRPQRYRRRLPPCVSGLPSQRSMQNELLQFRPGSARTSEEPCGAASVAGAGGARSSSREPPAPTAPTRRSAAASWPAAAPPPSGGAAPALRLLRRLRLGRRRTLRRVGRGRRLGARRRELGRERLGLGGGVVARRRRRCCRRLHRRRDGRRDALSSRARAPRRPPRAFSGPRSVNAGGRRARREPRALGGEERELARRAERALRRARRVVALGLHGGAHRRVGGAALRARAVPGARGRRSRGAPPRIGRRAARPLGAGSRRTAPAASRPPRPRRSRARRSDLIRSADDAARSASRSSRAALTCSRR